MDKGSGAVEFSSITFCFWTPSPRILLGGCWVNSWNRSPENLKAISSKLLLLKEMCLWRFDRIDPSVNGKTLFSCRRIQHAYEAPC